MGDFGDLVKIAADNGRFLGEVVEGVFLLEDVEVGQCGGAGEGVSGVGVAVVEGGVGVGFVEEGLEDIVGGEGGGEGQVAGGDAFGEAEEVGFDILVFTGEHLAGAAEAGGDLIDDEEGVVFLGELGHAREEAGGVDEDAGGTLDERFDDDGCDLAWVLGKEAVHFVEAVVTALVGRAIEAVGVGRGGQEGREGEGAEDFVENAYATDTYSAEGVAVVGVFQGEEGGAGLVEVSPVLVGDFEGDFDGGSAGVGIEDAGE